MKNDIFKLMINDDYLNRVYEIEQDFVEFAKIRNVSQNKDVMFVVYDKHHSIDCNYPMFATKMESTDGNIYWLAVAREEYIDRFKKNPKNMFFPVFHELGHFVNGDYDANVSYDLLSKMRKDMISSGKVLEQELKADEFAFKQIGKKSTVINALEYSIQRRKKIDNSELAIKELQLRKNHIKKL